MLRAATTKGVVTGGGGDGGFQDCGRNGNWPRPLASRAVRCIENAVKDGLGNVNRMESSVHRLNGFAFTAEKRNESGGAGD